MSRGSGSTQGFACDSRTILEQAYDGKVSAYTTHMTDEVLGRVHIVVQTKPGAIPSVPTPDVEAPPRRSRALLELMTCSRH